MNKEARFFEVEDIEIRTEGEGDQKEQYAEGVGIVYDREVEILPGFMERVRKGAFDKSIRGTAEIKSFFNHNADWVLSTTRSNPQLSLDDTDKGLRYRSPIPPTTYGNDLRVNLQRKNVRGSSFAFTVYREGQILTRDEKGVLHREITKATLHEVGPVTNPAYAKTTASLRSNKDVYDECLQIAKEQEAKEKNASGEADLELRKKITETL